MARWLSDLAGTLRDFTVKGFLYVTGKYMTASGTNTYTATPAVALSAYTTGLEITVKFTNANTGASTLNVSSLGAKTIQINGAAVTSGQIVAGGTYVMVYDGTSFQLLGSGTGSGGSGSASANTLNIAQTSHGFSVGNVLKRTSGSYALAQADSSADAEVAGIVSVVIDSNNFTLLTDGYITGLSGLTDATVYFLSDSSAGALSATEPTTTGHVSKPLLIADSATSGWFFNFRGDVLTSSAVSFTKGTATVDFGTGATDALVAVTQSGSWTVAQAWIEPAATSNNTADNHVVENLQCYAKDIVAGTSFNIYLKCTQGRAYGQFNVAWLVG